MNVRSFRDSLVTSAKQLTRLELGLGLAFVLMWVAALFPLWSPRMLPLLDLPDHLDAIAIWHRYDDPSWGYQHYYRLNLLPLPYWGYFFPVHMLSYLFPIEVANKIYLSAYALALPIGASWLARQMGRSAWLGLFAFPLVFNMNFAFGFITFCAGTTLMLFALVVLDRFLEAPTRGRGIALFVLTTFLYTTHVLPWLFFGVAAGVLLCCHGARFGRIAIASALMLPSVALGAIAFRMSRDGSTHVRPGPLEYKAKFEPLSHRIEQVVHRVIATWNDDNALMVIVALGVVWFFVMMSSRKVDDAEERLVESPGFKYRLELLVVLGAWATLTLPMHLLKPVDLWMIGGRFVFVTLLLGSLLPRGPIVGRGSGWRALWLVPLVALHIGYCRKLTKQWREFDRRASPVRRLCSTIPHGSSTLTVILGDLSDPAVQKEQVPYVQFHAYPQFYGGGYDPWALNTGFPMTLRPGVALPAPRWKSPSSFRFDEHGIYYDYILVRGEGSDHQVFGPNDGPLAPMVGHDGDWRLYHVLDKQKPPSSGVDPATGRPFENARLGDPSEQPTSETTH